jgi:hypothetical protein
MTTEDYLTHIEPIAKVKDTKLNIEFIAQYNLLLQVSHETFRMAIVDTLENKCLHTEEYLLEGVNGLTGKLLEQLHVIFDEHHLLNAGFWKSIKLTVLNDCFTLVPSSLFIEDSAKDYLRFNCEFDSNFDVVASYKHSSLGIVNVFAAERRIIDWFKAIYPAKKIELLHQSSTCIEGLFQNIKNRPAITLLANVGPHLITIIAADGKNVLYSNTFHYKTEEDLSYFILLVMDELKMDVETDLLLLYGDIQHDSDLYNRLYNCIRNVRFGLKPATIKFGFWFDEIFDHKYFDLYSSHFCE